MIPNINHLFSALEAIAQTRLWRQRNDALAKQANVEFEKSCQEAKRSHYRAIMNEDLKEGAE